MSTNDPMVRLLRELKEKGEVTIPVGSKKEGQRIRWNFYNRRESVLGSGGLVEESFIAQRTKVFVRNDSITFRYEPKNPLDLLLESFDKKEEGTEEEPETDEREKGKGAA
jgi:hypothetical protein